MLPPPAIPPPYAPPLPPFAPGQGFINGSLPVAVNGSGAGGAGAGGALAAVDHGPPVAVPVQGAIYMWYSGNFTSDVGRWSAPLRVAANEVDFRGSLDFVYYHQVVSSIACVNSSEFNMNSIDGSSEYAGGAPEGGFPITILGSGFDGYDGNASTVRVRFTTQIAGCSAEEIAAERLAATANSTANSTANGTANGTASGAPAAASVALTGGGDGAANGTACGKCCVQGNDTLANGTAMVVEVVAHSVTATQVVVHAPAMSLLEGEIITERGYPCWNPPCRRTVVTLAINGVDFLGRPEPLAFYFYHEPWRFPCSGRSCRSCSLCSAWRRSSTPCSRGTGASSCTSVTSASSTAS